MKWVCESVNNPFIIFSCMNVLGTGCTSNSFPWTRHGLFILRNVLRNHCLHARFVMVHFIKALASLFVCHAKFSSADALFLHPLSVFWLVRFGFLFECFRATFHPHPSVLQDLVKLPMKKVRHFPCQCQSFYIVIHPFYMLNLFTFNGLLFYIALISLIQF